MKQYLNKEIGIRCKYQGAPVKINQRCVIKSTSDYARKPFPSVANILKKIGRLVATVQG